MNRVPNIKGGLSAVDVCAAAFDRLGACAAVLDGDGIIVATNRGWRLFAHLNDGSDETTGIGVNYLEICDLAASAGVTGSADVATGLRQILGGEREHIDMEYPCPSPTEARWFLLQASALPVSNAAGAVVVHVDITARKELADRLVGLVDHDPLTALPNRRAALRFLNEGLASARGADRAMSALFIDIDDFKAVNDTFGHHVGDELLIKVGLRIRRAVRNDDRLCRLGGDEFVVICPRFQRADALALARRLRVAMTAPFQIGDLEISVAISVGVAESDATSTAQTMLGVADQQMYIDKRRLRSAHAATQRVADPTPPSLGSTSTPETSPSERLANFGKRAAVALSASSDLILFFSAEGSIEWASPSCTHLLAAEPDDIVGLSRIDFIHPDDQASAIVAFASIPNNGDHVTTVFRLVDAARRIRWVEEIVTNHLDDPAVRGVVGKLRDVTERVNLLERIENDRRRLADTQAAARLGSFEIDLKTGEISRSDEMCRILGVPIGINANASGLETIHPDDRPILTAMLDRAVAGQSEGEVEYRIVRPTGEVRWVLTHGIKLAAPNDGVIVGTMLDITDRHFADETLAFQATHDWLTKLPNPASFRASLQDKLTNAGMDARVLVASISIDNFDQVNDIRGSLTGDAILCDLAARLSGHRQPGDIAGRARDDEFIIARTVPAANQNAAQFARSLQQLAAEPHLPLDVEIAQPLLSVSVGVTSGTATDTPELLLADANAAMREAKNFQSGLVIFDDDSRARTARRRHVAAELPLALDRKQLRLEYQPIIDLTSLRTVGFEALLRWNSPLLGVITPDEFIPIAEASRLIIPIGAWVFETAVRQLADWHQEPGVPPTLWMAINLSAQQLAQNHLLTQTKETLQRFGVPAAAVHLEITESILMDHIEHAVETVAELHSLGVHISVDDFGTGYSSLSYLSRLTVDTIKIDRSFVNEIGAPRDGTSIIRAMITLANTLGLDVVAEGIETTRQLEELQTLGCTYGQGYLWSRAIHSNSALQRVIHESELQPTSSAQQIASANPTQPLETADSTIHPARTHVTQTRGQQTPPQPHAYVDILHFGTLEIELRARTTRLNGNDLNLTAKEFELLAHFATHPNQSFTREQLLQHVWHSSAAWQSKATVTEHIYRLRNHIEDNPRRPQRLRTDRGHGYHFSQ